jgi:hypothetical protein
MHGTIIRIAATGAGAVLAVGLLAVPPAGAKSDRDGKSERSSKVSAACFDTSGKTQGRSYSDPDGGSNGGIDKPGCTGGVNADRDGNNGCGNDTDREDDNNGRCGGQKASQKDRARDAKGEKDKPAKVEAVKAERLEDEPSRDHEAKVKDAKAEGDQKTRCERKDDDTDTTPSTVGTDVSAAASAKNCSCPKNPDDADVSGTVAGAKVETVASETDTSVLAANAALVPAGLDSTATMTAASTTVSGGGSTSPAGVEADTETTPQTSVLGETLTRPSALARTGAGLGGLALLGGLLCGGGRLAALGRRLLRNG